MSDNLTDEKIIEHLDAIARRIASTDNMAVEDHIGYIAARIIERLHTELAAQKELTLKWAGEAAVVGADVIVKDKRIEELEKNYNRLHGEGIAQQASIEELEEGTRVDLEDQERYLKINADLRAELKECEDTYESLAGVDIELIRNQRLRIKELERILDDTIGIDNISFSIDQIDAAWGFNEDSSQEIKAHGRAMLYSYFRIDACEECGGSGSILANCEGSVHEIMCDDCHGHGWVKRAVSDE